MSESSSEKVVTGRRNFLKKMVGASVGVAGVTGLATREIKIPENGLETPAGIFYPLYERHDVGIEADVIPDDLDVLFREKVMGKNDYARKPQDLLTEESYGPNGESYEVFKYDVLNKLSHNQIEIIFGDSGFGSFRGVDVLAKQQIDQLEKRAKAGIIIGGTGIMYEQIRNSLDTYGGTKPSKSEVSRRKLIRNAFLGAGAISVAPLFNFYLGGIRSAFGGETEGRDAVKRILTRIGGLITHLSPEDHVIFFRSLVMADKILTVAEKIHEEKGRKPKVGFNVGSGHSGIEDMLLAGHDFCRFLLTNYPADFLQEVVDSTGGIDNFATARVLKFPPNLQLDPEKKLYTVKYREIHGENAIEDLPIGDRRITDSALENALKAKLSANKNKE